MSSTDFAEETITKLKKPNKWAVMIHNNDVTSMEFVVALLVTVFKHNQVIATDIMYAIHTNGKAAAGIYTKEVAEQKLEEAHALIQANRQRLKLSLEEQDS